MSDFEQLMKDAVESTGAPKRMNLQFFAEGGGEGTEGGGEGSGKEGVGKGTGKEEGEKGTGKNKKAPTFDELLSNREHQAEFDQRVQKAIDTALTKEREKLEVLADEKVSEAKKLEKMNAEEKARYEVEKREKKLAEKEKELLTRELKAEAMAALTEKELPLGLAECLVYTDAESCNKSIAAVKKAFEESVKTAVEEKLKGKPPINKAPGSEENPQKMSYEDFCNQLGNE